jgi:DNA repair protein RadD
MLRWVFVHTSHLSLNACGALAFGVTNDELTDVCSTRAAEVVGLAVEVLNEEFWKFNGDGPATFRSGPGGHGMRASGGILPVRFRNWIVWGKVGGPLVLLVLHPVLRPRQVQALSDLRSAYGSGSRAPVLVAPTGFGKTATAAEIVRQAVAKGRKVWFLAHLREILDDTSQRLTAAGISHGQIRAGKSADYSAAVQVVAVQTAVKRPELPRPDLVIVDECHLAVAATYQKVFEAVGRPLLLGLTGTPQRLDGRGMGEVFDRLVLTCSTSELIDEQLLAPVRVYAPPGADLSGLRSRMGEYDQGQASEILSRPQVVGDALNHWQKLGQGRRGVAFCTTVAHAQAVAEQWREAGLRALAVHGGSDDAERREAIVGLRAGRLDLVACAQLWIAGVDVPEIDAVIWLRPTQSLTSWLQGNGRGLRIAEGKRDLLILDHVGNCIRLGHPLDVHEWSLEGRAKKKRDSGPSVKICPQCFAAMSSQARQCPECGHEFAPEKRELQHVPGQLQEVTRGIPRARFHEQRQAQTLEDLIAVGERRGMKNPRGWARHVMAARQLKGRW